MLKGELAQLAQRKRELLLESDINRQILRVEACQLQLKAVEWKRGLLKAQTAYKWIAPIAGMGFAFYGMKKKMAAHAHNGKHNGRGSNKSLYLKLLGPVGMIAVRKALNFWRHARKRNAHA